MILAFNDDHATESIDATFAPRNVVLEAAKTVAAQLHNESTPDIVDCWLKDAAVLLMSSEVAEHPRSEKIGPALTLSVADPEFVLVMKTFASRQSQGDIDDAVTLCRLLNISTPRQLEALVALYFPGRPFKSHTMSLHQIIDAL